MALSKAGDRDSQSSAVALPRQQQKMLLMLGMVLSAAHVGCSQSPHELAPVRGKVTIDGRPLTAGRMMFAPIGQGTGHDAGKPAFGMLQPDGSYTLTTYRDNDGAVVGEHWVTIFGPRGGAEPAALEGRSGTRLPKFHRFVVRHKQPVVAGEDNQIDIRLTSSEIARFASQQ